LYENIHTARVDTDTAARVMGYSGSTNGAAASALGTLRQFKLVDGLRGDLRVSDLAMRIVQPMNALERAIAIEEAAFAPEVFAKLKAAFPAKIPTVDDPLRAYLVRTEHFSGSGASEAINAFRDTLGVLESLPQQENPVELVAESKIELNQHVLEDSRNRSTLAPAEDLADDVFKLNVPLKGGVQAQVTIFGEVSPKTLSQLIRHIELVKETLEDDD
jgi:hypothetical protein